MITEEMFMYTLTLCFLEFVLCLEGDRQPKEAQQYYNT